MGVRECHRDVLQLSIDSSWEIIVFGEEDNDMEEPQNSRPILPTSLQNNGLHFGAMRFICLLVRNDIVVPYIVAFVIVHFYFLPFPHFYIGLCY